MRARLLEHVNIRTTDLAATIRFYTEVLGLREGWRPSTRPGGWLYDERDVPVIHLAFYDPDDAAQREHIERYLGARDPSTLHGGGAIDHVAFAAVDHDAFADKLDRLGWPHRKRVTDSGLPQIFVDDPNGITIELNFNDERKVTA